MGLTVGARLCAKTRVLAFFFLTAALALAPFIAEPGFAQPTDIRRADEGGLWTALISQASGLGLPIRFLRVIPADFIAVEFADLRTFAAEYHPETHRMVLNRALSFNAAGRVLRPLAGMNHRDVATIYHELFHAYMDYISAFPDPGAIEAEMQRLLAFAKEQQECRYSFVQITPLPQKKTVIEPRFLSDRESWEALNETWAVFVGWAIWTKLEVGGSSQPAREKFGNLLKKADQSSLLVGYYEPEDSKERAVTHKRYLSPGNRISQSEVMLLLEVVLGENAREAARLAAVMRPNPAPVPGTPGCQKEK